MEFGGRQATIDDISRRHNLSSEIEIVETGPMMDFEDSKHVQMAKTLPKWAPQSPTSEPHQPGLKLTVIPSRSRNPVAMAQGPPSSQF
ncbi:hypothetical protein AVEN_250163-1 [Araneus ventricosus]|uniref:Uncharacterized protein n=1 Tax=Araneus ventricosus TaxID=182803 RepID=A0A4Y2MNF3_ARAVE|nr:hypothetical protein AVEN_250163-1 [Araneus ventricosus]